MIVDTRDNTLLSTRNYEDSNSMKCSDCYPYRACTLSKQSDSKDCCYCTTDECTKERQAAGRTDIRKPLEQGTVCGCSPMVSILSLYSMPERWLQQIRIT